MTDFSPCRLSISPWKWQVSVHPTTPIVSRVTPTSYPVATLLKRTDAMVSGTVLSTVLMKSVVRVHSVQDLPVPTLPSPVFVTVLHSAVMVFIIALTSPMK